MIHRATFLSRLHLPPTSPNFPHASLLHAICAAASPFTALVNSMSPEALEPAISQQKNLGLDLENIEDFGIAQAEAGERSIRSSIQTCIFGPGRTMFEITRATVSWDPQWT